MTHREGRVQKQNSKAEFRSTIQKQNPKAAFESNMQTQNPKADFENIIQKPPQRNPKDKSSAQKRVYATPNASHMC